MSILIKGLTLPRTCVFPCIVAVADNRLLISDVNENTIFEGEYAEVPTPHGRLIDADKLLESFREALNEDRCFVNFSALVDDSPTVIEAEASE